MLTNETPEDDISKRVSELFGTTNETTSPPPGVNEADLEWEKSIRSLVGESTPKPTHSSVGYYNVDNVKRFTSQERFNPHFLWIEEDRQLYSLFPFRSFFPFYLSYLHPSP